MTSPHLKTTARRALLVLALWGFVQTVAAAEKDHRAEVMDALRSGLPRYEAKDPTVAKQTSPETPASKKKSEESDKSVETPKPQVGPATDGAIVMPKMTIHPLPDLLRKPDHPLPTLPVPKNYSDVKLDDFLSGPERDRLLVAKHLSSFDRNFLNRVTLPIIGISKEARAREAERTEQNAVLLNRVSDILNIDQQLGIETDEDKKLREEYRRLMRDRLK